MRRETFRFPNRCFLITATGIKGRHMTLQFFADKPQDGDGKRYRAINTVGAWMWGRNHLPKDLVAALHYLIPELKREACARSDEHGRE
jgi:hypothetical protein